MDDGGIDASFVHQADGFLGGKCRHLPMRRIARQAGSPEVNLGVDDSAWHGPSRVRAGCSTVSRRPRPRCTRYPVRTCERYTRNPDGCGAIYTNSRLGGRGVRTMTAGAGPHVYISPCIRPLGWSAVPGIARRGAGVVPVVRDAGRWAAALALSAPRLATSLSPRRSGRRSAMLRGGPARTPARRRRSSPPRRRRAVRAAGQHARFTRWPTNTAPAREAARAAQRAKRAPAGAAARIGVVWRACARRPPRRHRRAPPRGPRGQRGRRAWRHIKAGRRPAVPASRTTGTTTRPAPSNARRSGPPSGRMR